MINFSFSISSNDYILNDFIINSYTLTNDNLKLDIVLDSKDSLHNFLDTVMHKVIKHVTINILESDAVISVIDFNTTSQKVVTIIQDKQSSKINTTLSLDGKLAFIMNK